MRIFLPLCCVCVIILSIVGGCSDSSRVSIQNDTNQDDLSALGTVVSVKQEVEIDLGQLEEDHVFDYKLDGLGEKEIWSIIRSCGCVGPALIEGQKWNFDERPFTINISLTGKYACEGMQDFLLSFTDGTTVRVNVKYVYLPLPTHAPESIIFKKEEVEKEIMFSFYSEKDITIKSVELPSYISYTQRTASDSDDPAGSFVVTFVLDRNNLDGERDGVIKIHTTSKRKPQFTVPFLVLRY